ncbi:hypothetical protein BHM03_00023318 [Ensete ventricosum]|nr:hypothetical protein BHM03_00023318 [Ensete ventricosum]
MGGETGVPENSSTFSWVGLGGGLRIRMLRLASRTFFVLDEVLSNGTRTRPIALQSHSKSGPEPAVAMADHGTMTEISFAGRFSSSAIAACFAEVPRSLAPSLQEKAATDAMAMPKYRGMLATVATIARKE